MSCKNNVSRGCCFKRDESKGTYEAQYKSGCQKMDVYDWMGEIENPTRKYDVFEVQFKNTRKGYYVNENKDVKYKKGDVVVVESSPGYNIGVITMCSDMVERQMRRKGFSTKGCEFMKILRFPNSIDIQRWEEAISLEHTTMIKSRQICTQFGLDMKVGDVEYQADKMKAIFYYIADGRVDFRELIKALADQFRVRVEMKQIGSRQEAGLIGGLAACGRELCCSTWYNNFSTVVIGAARVQDISPNPLKLAGQCGKLKCCLNYELDGYLDARERLPYVNHPLESLEASYFLVKTDVLRGIMYFSSDPKNPAVQIPLSAERVRYIQSLNKKGQKIDNIQDMAEVVESVAVEPDFGNVVGQDSLTRFDKAKKSNKRRKGGNRDGANRDNINKENGSSEGGSKEGNDGGNRGNENRGRRFERGGNRENTPKENVPREGVSKEGDSRANREGGRDNRRDNRGANRGGDRRDRGGNRGQGGNQQSGENRRESSGGEGVNAAKNE